jgi:hypothetical protein
MQRVSRLEKKLIGRKAKYRCLAKIQTSPGLRAKPAEKDSLKIIEKLMKS